MKLRLTIRPQADRDLVEQAEYLARNAGLPVALKFYAAAEETFSVLAARVLPGARDIDALFAAG